MEIKQAIEKLKEEMDAIPLVYYDGGDDYSFAENTGTKSENARLQPILDRALKALEVAVSALDWYADVDPENTSEYTKAGLHLRAKATRGEIAAILEGK